MTPKTSPVMFPAQPGSGAEIGSTATSPSSSAAETATAGPGRRRRLWFLAGILLSGTLLLVAGTLEWRMRQTAPPPPSIDLTGVDPFVAKVLTAARAEVEKNRRSAKAWGMLGKVLRAHEFYGEADLALNRAAELDPRDPRWPYLIARGPICTDPDVALPYLQRAVQHCQDAKVPRLALGELLLEMGRLEEAEGQFLAVLQSPPPDPRAYFGLGRIAFQRGDIEGAKNHLCRSSAAAPHVKAVHVLLAEAYSRSGDRNAARDQMRTAIGMPDNATWPDPYLNEVASLRVGLKSQLMLAENLQAQGRGDAAVQSLRVAVRDYPTDYRSCLSLGQLLNRLGRCTEAEQPLRTALRLLADSGVIYLELGHSLQNQSRDEEAAACYQTAIRLEPNLAQAHFNLSLMLSARADLAGAQKELREAVRYEPDFVEGYINLGKLLSRQGQFAGALKEIELAARLAPDDETIAALVTQLKADVAQSAEP